VGAGGNAGAVLAGFLFKSDSLTYQQGLLYLGCAVALTSFMALAVRFSPETIASERKRFDEAVATRGGPVPTIPVLAE
jgi:MFS transporter, NNP family, nitrate/nitrite transporter